ncbi:MAG: PAM68 family protein [Calothrix sp. MO_167.B42]|nr:PAM68 family protein [Calothrix sp. MO_167.B42]
MSAESEKNRFPFEPNKKRQKSAKTKAETVKNVNKSEKQSVDTKKVSGKQKKQSKKPAYTKEQLAIPKVVSQRMMRRVAAFCGVPTLLGISTLIVSYLLLIYTEIKLPPISVLLLNLGFFGLGVLGITYGVLSASWEEDRAGGVMGWQEFNTNRERMVAAWRESKQKKV